MDLGDILGPRAKDVEIRREKVPPKNFDPPRGVTAISEHGLRIPCDVRYDGTERHGLVVFARYQILAELNWSTTKLTRIELEHWPDLAIMMLEFKGFKPGDLPPDWVKDVEWVELQGPPPGRIYTKV